MMLNRKKQPTIQAISHLTLPEPQIFHLSNGIPVYVVNMGTQEVVKLEVVFTGGRVVEEKQMVAKTMSSMLKEGTANFTSTQIADQFDFYGASLNTPTSMDYTHVVFHSLTKHFKNLIPLFTELLLSPSFPQKELKTWIENNKRRLKVDLTKVDVVAYRKATEYIFGETHPYGYNSSLEGYDALTRKDLIRYYQKNVHAQNCAVFVSGRITDEILQLLEQHLSQLPKGKKAKKPILHPTTDQPQKIFIPFPDASQTAVCIGKRSLVRAHPDFGGFMVLNTILGGYFGSRLMTNIREEKGYTYNISSMQDAMMHDSCFYISTEAAKEFTDKAVAEIYIEMEKLQQELVPEAELQMVKNYLLGTILNMIDGPFHVAGVIKAMVLDNRPLSDFQKMVHLIQHISAQELRDIAQKHLQKETMWEVLVG